MCWETEKWLGEINGLAAGWEGGRSRQEARRAEESQEGERGEFVLYKSETCWWREEMTWEECSHES